MSPNDSKIIIKEIKEHRKDVTSSEKKAKDFLVRAGILSKNGQTLAPAYR